MPEPKYKFRYDDMGNVLFLDYGGGQYSNYDYRWRWTRRNHSSQVDDWFLVPFPSFHPNSLGLLKKELIYAQRAYDEIDRSRSCHYKSTR